MSEPVSNADVEDVLASIRRLVSEDKRPLRPAAKAAVDDARAFVADAARDNERLVLTPSLRVADAPEPGTEDVTGAPDKIDTADADASAEVADQPLVLRDAVMPDTVDGVENAEVVGEEATETVSDSQVDGETLAEAAPEEFGFDEDPFDFSPVDAAPDEVASDATEEAGYLDAAEGEVEEAPFMEAEEVSFTDDHSADVTDLDQEAADPEDQGDAPAAENDEKVTSFRVAGSLGAKIAALESMVGRRGDAWEPDGSEDDDGYSGGDPMEMTWRETDDVDGAEPDAAPQADMPMPVNEASLVPDEDLLDEEALRDMVAEIVRQELQGALGERITRNVRKLVRREIHRALATRELD
ncbi:hypothetical protein E4Z66_10400 [Aliishimia ponticola]|uniref:DUF2497 domain-containing protein n=1 Tax=Aliishimia ponticola TaxID=2499833 RepID=A0A4S4NCY0_9RHOB|nr:hypothetical protein [Aliishimia ponticola]THH37316.1 hypothetical protein E4Z66_10400 [Aliishimia ponticola]